MPALGDLPVVLDSVGQDASPTLRQTIVPESLRQRSGAPLFEDLAIFLGEAWAYNVSSISPQLAAAAHLWHGTGDLQARAVSLDLGLPNPKPCLLIDSVRVYYRPSPAHGFVAPACIHVLPKVCGGHYECNLTQIQHGSVHLPQVPDVSSRALHRLLPGSHLSIIPGGGHFAYYVCNPAAQRAALSQLLASAATA